MTTTPHWCFCFSPPHNSVFFFYISKWQKGVYFQAVIVFKFGHTTQKRGGKKLNTLVACAMSAFCVASSTDDSDITAKKGFCMSAPVEVASSLWEFVTQWHKSTGRNPHWEEQRRTEAERKRVEKGKGMFLSFISAVAPCFCMFFPLISPCVSLCLQTSFFLAFMPGRLRNYETAALSKDIFFFVPPFPAALYSCTLLKLDEND